MDLDLGSTLLQHPIKIYNDNMACVNWSNSLTTKNLRHLQINENAVRESVQNKLVTIHHIPGSEKLSDIFTKEHKDPSHFLHLRNIVLSKPFPTETPMVSIPSKTPTSTPVS